MVDITDNIIINWSLMVTKNIQIFKKAVKVFWSRRNAIV
jgi:hypothetical protein